MNVYYEIDKLLKKKGWNRTTSQSVFYSHPEKNKILEPMHDGDIAVHIDLGESYEEIDLIDKNNYQKIDEL